MRTLILTLAAALALGACSSKHEASSAGAPPAPPVAEVTERQTNFLAYEHSLRIETTEDKVAPLHEAAVAACRADTENACALLESRSSAGNYASAFLKLRAKPEGIRKLTALLGSEGTVTNKSVTAEDLAAPIADTAKKIELLTNYRDRLVALLSRGGNDIEALMQLNREIAETQSQIETLQGDRAHLVRRVETELLSVQIDSLRATAFWSPIAAALRDFGGDLARGTAGAITALAYLVPWLLILLPLAWGVRKLWRRRKSPMTGD